MKYIFKQSFNTDFFQLLPIDWFNGIAPFWAEYADTSNIYTLCHNDEIIGGGIVFNSCSPDMLYNELEAQKWLKNGYLYIGFIWVKEEYRNKKIGSTWLQELINKFPAQKFWLTVDEEILISFYKKNGFKLIKSLQNRADIEWLLTYEPS